MSILLRGGAQLDKWNPRYFQAQVYFALQKAGSSWGLLDIPGIDNVLRIGGRICFLDGHCDLLIVDGRAEKARGLRRLFGHPDPAVREKAISDYKVLAAGFDEELYEQEAIALENISMTGTTEERAAIKDCMYLLARFMIKRREFSIPDVETFDTSFQARPLRPDELP